MAFVKTDEKKTAQQAEECEGYDVEQVATSSYDRLNELKVKELMKYLTHHQLSLVGKKTLSDVCYQYTYQCDVFSTVNWRMQVTDEWS